MAQSKVYKSTLALDVLVGTDDKGKDVFKKQSFGKIRTNADIEKVCEVGLNAAKLFNSAKVLKIDQSIITEE
ncbi:DUF1659 domain-containing protein [Clostridium botulinum]|nr:DUF1659 domain-containing protein [Clostridium botulinum]AEB77595.1 hypothetical protein CbC4_6074 [Clostridium botulinum BKT015925]KEH95991.1 hypothetical protein Y848_p0167 [Clostridium botulinum C/D str. Sp77]KEH96746.1 hypothetical protein Z953_14085 [Clostridium botulinum D str. 16868]KEI00086.1 hypothetical protein Z952_13965 [Clostridium botulinum C/D str. BKT75002]KEI05937.1 hypothetical protein Z954_14440 [Clostridium botulinum C/D str. BKT2873]